jgi:hypothetical protein
MQMTGEYQLSAPREAVWRSLNDPEVLKQCVPGCESLEKTSDNEFTAKVTLAVGPVKARFAGKVQLSEIDPPNGYRIAGEGQGGVAGFGKGAATVRLADRDGGTFLTYTAESTVGGKIAQLGARLIDSTAKKLADEFFARFAAIVQAGQPTAEAAPAAAPAAPPQAALATGEARRLSPAVWIPALIGVVALIWYFATR